MTGDEAVDKGETNAVVRSTYQAVYDEILDADDVRIADDATLVEFGDEAHYAETFDACKIRLIFIVNSRSKTTNCHIDLL